MKLELKHLAPYLPYGLHIKHNEGARLIICGAFKKYNRDDFFTYSLLNWDKDVKSTEAKPVLRPMSDYEKIDNDFDLSTDFDSTYVASNEDLACINTGNATYLSDMLRVTDFLFAQHFDVFGLIPAGLAIDINTLK